ncbi:unnamed protein product [Closterium sp. Naga37s-1]|nr:unnamed protein product [Closterium sp. Naga37s-1]
MRAGAASVVFEKPSSASGAGTTATESPPPSAPKPVTIDVEKALPLVSVGPHDVSEAGLSAPVVAPPAPPVAPVPPAPVVAPAASAPAGGVAVPPVPVPGTPVAPAVSVPGELASASVSSPKAASATTDGPAPMVAPPGVGQPAPALLSAAPVVQPNRPQSPDRRLSRPHSPAPQQERESTRRRRNSPRRYQQQAQWPARHGGNGGWRGPRGAFRPPVTMADLQREVSRAVREERAAQSQSSSLRAAPAHVAPRQTGPPMDPPPAAAFPPPVLAPSAPSPSFSAPAPGSRLHLPPVPPVAGVEFVAAGGGTTAQPSHVVAADVPKLFLTEALQPPQTRVPEATLGQSLHALLLIQVLAHSSLPVIPPDTFRGHQRDTYLDAADQLTALLAPVLAAPAEGGAAAAGQLDEAREFVKEERRLGEARREAVNPLNEGVRYAQAS